MQNYGRKNEKCEFDKTTTTALEAGHLYRQERTNADIVDREVEVHEEVDLGMHQVGCLFLVVHRAHNHLRPEKRLETDSVQMKCDKRVDGEIVA
jgi:hypothetical protein